MIKIENIKKIDPCFLSCEASLGILSVAGDFECDYTLCFINESLSKKEPKTE
jgi:hypothetical protein